MPEFGTDSPPRWLEHVLGLEAPRLDRLSTHSDCRVWHVDIRLDPWDPPTGVHLTRKDTYGWKPMVVPQEERLARSCGRSVGEVELSCRMRAAGWTDAFWSDGFGSAPEVWRRWVRRQPEMPRAVRELDRSIRCRVPELERQPKAGFPDVIAPANSSAPVQDRLVFVEYKGPKVANPRGLDAINELQDIWVRSALDRELIALEDYVVVRWTPTAEDRIVLARQQAAWVRKS